MFTEKGFDQRSAARGSDQYLGKTERELQLALAKLQSIRGAA